jgi:hypothetical protein
MLQVNLPHVVAEVAAAYQRYEHALEANDVQALDALFWDSPLTVRYGVRENLYGHAEIASFRATARPAGGKVHEGTVLTTFGEDAATVNTMFRRPDTPSRIGRQSQSWVRTPNGWRIVAAHVSVIEL